MTFAVGHVAGGSHAGWKIQKPAPKPWTCDCFVTAVRPFPKQIRPSGVTVMSEPKQQPAYMARCTDCGTRRP